MYIIIISFTTTKYSLAGISLSCLLKGKKDESENQAHPQQKFSNLSFISDDSKNAGSREHSFCELIGKFNRVRERTYEDGKYFPKNEDSPKMSSFIDRIMYKQNKMPQVPIPIKRKRTLWYKLASFVHLRKWKKTIPEPSEQIEQPKLNRCDTQQNSKKSETQSYQSSNRSATPPENRRTSWQPSKPSVSNWNRSELFTDSTEEQLMRKRRKTIADAGMLLKTNLCQERLHKKLPGILMTGSGLNVKNESPDISPMSSNYSLTPSTSEEEEEEREANKVEVKTEKSLQQNTADKVTSVKVPSLPSGADNMQEFVTKIVCDFKATMDSYIVSVSRFFSLSLI